MKENASTYIEIFISGRDMINNWIVELREKEGDLTQSYDKTPYTNRKFENKRTTHKRHQKFRLHNDCGPT